MTTKGGLRGETFRVILQISHETFPAPKSTDDECNRDVTTVMGSIHGN
jgi:hypothetical protein